MENNQKGLSFSINEDTIKYFRNKKKYAKNVKIMKFVFGASALLTAGLLGGFLATGTSALGWLAVGLGVTSICNRIVLSYFNHEKKLCDNFWGKLKSDIKKTYGPVRNLRVVRGRDFSNLRNAEFTSVRHYVENGILRTKRVNYYDDKYKEGVESTQDILVANVAGKDVNLFAVEENKFHYVNCVSSYDYGKLCEYVSRENVGYRVVYGDNIRVDETLSIERPKSRRRTRKPQGR